MSKKLILTAAVASIVASQAYAATWDTTLANVTPVHTKEGIIGTPDATGTVIGNAQVRLGTEYYVGDKVKFTYAGLAFSAANVIPTSFSSHVAGTETDCVIHTAAATGSATVNVGCPIGGSGTTYGTGKITVGDQFTCQNANRTAAPADADIKDVVFTVLTLPTTGTVTVSPALTAAQNCATGEAVVVKKPKTMTMGLLTSDTNSITYRVGTLGAGTTTVGQSLASPAGLLVHQAGLATNGTSNLTFSATSGTDAMDTLTGGTVIAKAIDKTALAVTKFDGVVDVEQSKLAFTTGNSTTSADIVTFDFTNGTAVNGNNLVNTSGVYTIGSNDATAVVSTANTVIHTVDGDFTWMDDATTAGITTTKIVCSGATITGALASTGDKFTATDTGVADTACTVAKETKTKAQVLPVQTYSGKSVFKWTSTSAQTATTTHASLGAWTLNGASITVYGLPMGSSVDRMIWVNNKGATDAVMTGEFTLNGVTTSNLALGTAASKTSTSVDEALDTALTAAGVTPPASSRGTLVLTAPVKTADIVVTAAYKVKAADDRLSLETSDTIDDVITKNNATSAAPTYTSK